MGCRHLEANRGVEAQAFLLKNFRVGKEQPNECAQWLTKMARDLLAPIPFREVFVILALFPRTIGLPSSALSPQEGGGGQRALHDSSSKIASGSNNNEAT